MSARIMSANSKVFKYRQDDWFDKEQSNKDSSFDRMLKQAWSEASNSDVMNYRIEPNQGLPTRVVSNHPFYLLAAYIPGRGPGKRRTPEAMTRLSMPFDHNKFNFTRIDASELLFQLEFTSQTGQVLEASVIVNKSPVEYCSSLLVPFLSKCFPQVLTAESLTLAIQVVALSGQRSIRLGFNSLGSMASVNHLHWHIYYLHHPLSIESLPIVDNILQDWPVPAITYELDCFTEQNIEVVVHKIMKIVDYCLQDGEIAHNLFVCRSSRNNIRVLLWLLQPVFGLKDSLNINSAICELSGYFICKTRHMFEQLGQAQCLQVLEGRRSLHSRVAHLI